MSESTANNIVADNTTALRWKDKRTDHKSNQIYTGSNTEYSVRDLSLNLSRANSIYGNSDTVQPPAVKLLPIIKY